MMERLHHQQRASDVLKVFAETFQKLESLFFHSFLDHLQISCGWVILLQLAPHRFQIIEIDVKYVVSFGCLCDVIVQLIYYGEVFSFVINLSYWFPNFSCRVKEHKTLCDIWLHGVQELAHFHLIIHFPFSEWRIRLLWPLNLTIDVTHLSTSTQVEAS